MKQFVFGALVATAVLGAAGFAVVKESSAARSNVPISAADLTLNRAVRCQAQITPTQPWVVTMPTMHGFAMTTLRIVDAVTNSYDAQFDINVGGCIETYWMRTLTPTNGFAEIRFDPPMIIAPGATASVSSATPSWTSGFANFVVGGYVVYPGEI